MIGMQFVQKNDSHKYDYFDEEFSEESKRIKKESEKTNKKRRGGDVKMMALNQMSAFDRALIRAKRAE